jgi:NAD(P)-dependent dehydrogenase (short-subunit alcohol dehydrogenase family)
MMSNFYAPFHPVYTDNGNHRNRYRDMAGMVVVLIGENTTTVRSLIAAFAQKGAHIVVVCSHASQAALTQMRYTVEALGRRLHFINTETTEYTAEPVVPAVVAEFGRADVFIDLSAQRGGR